MAKHKATYGQWRNFVSEVTTAKRFLGSDLCKKHGVTKSATVAMKEMGYLKSSQGHGCLYIGPEPKDEAHLDRLTSEIMKQSLGRQRGWRTKARHVIKRPAPRRELPSSADAFFQNLPHSFTAGEAVSIGQRIGISRTTVQRILHKDSRIVREKHGRYYKMSLREGGITIALEKEPERIPNRKGTKHVGILRRLLRWIW